MHLALKKTLQYWAESCRSNVEHFRRAPTHCGPFLLNEWQWRAQGRWSPAQSVASGIAYFQKVEWPTASRRAYFEPIRPKGGQEGHPAEMLHLLSSICDASMEDSMLECLLRSEAPHACVLLTAPTWGLCYWKMADK